MDDSYRQLTSLDLPDDLASLDREQLAALADEIRFFLVERLSKTGGHLSSNLGVVELTIALHRMFDSPHDQLIWDVGHQAYVHKILTGRAGDFGALRRLGGLSGYPSREESPHDFVENSHASTSLSYAMGLAAARDDDGYVVAVIGDGALTGGIAYEALNHIAQEQPDRLIIVVNDNGRSYAPTVGGLARHLATLRLDPRYERAKRLMGRLMRRVPRYGDVVDEGARRLKESAKQIVQPSTFFDVLSIKYTGPIDGHDIEQLEWAFERARALGEPVVIHAVTEKGHGYQPAIDHERDKLHGVGAFDVATGGPLHSSLTFTSVVDAAMEDLASRRPDVVAISAAMTDSTGLGAMAGRYPGRVFDVGICEQHAVTLAAGLAMGGKRPVVCIYATFFQRALDQVTMDVALHGLPVVFILDRSGVTGPDGPSHHGVFDLAHLRTVPGLSIAAPSNGAELSGLLETAIEMSGPVAIRIPKAEVPAMPSLPAAPIPVGEWEELQHGNDVLLVGFGRMVETVAKAAVMLEERGLSCGVANARWLRPLDGRLAEWAEHYDRVVTVEDTVVAGGFGSAVLEALSSQGLAGKVTILGLPVEFVPFGNPEALLASYGLDAEGIVAAITN